jgi:Asp-tRNA(Asn)/Glu-tRNA(Gln) amidotransferase A subunit family amidase
VTWAYACAGREISAPDYIRAVQTFHRAGRRLGAFFARYDVLLSPTIARSSLPLGTIRTDDSLAAFRAAMAPMIAYTMVHNAAGTPAASVPLGWTGAGLPVGVQISARLGGEATLVALAAQLERAKPWRDRKPPLTA